MPASGYTGVVFNHRSRPLLLAVMALAVTWLLVWGGFSLARSLKPTSEKVLAYLQANDLSRLTGEARARAIAELARKLNALDIEERRRARMDREFGRWFLAMTEEEKAGFIEATMPTGVKQMIASFEKLPEEKRRRTIDEAFRRLREDRERMAREPRRAFDPAGGTNRPPELSEELQRKVTTVGLQTFYSSSSAQTKAELAPLLEELQRAMESGRAFRPVRQ
jgi:hypothetical protein